jgi:8-oxo-dGTP pyrophosphatase MutT (NUDIX family)
MLDISSAGHLSAGDDSLTGAIRELKEELNLAVTSDELQFIKTIKKQDKIITEFNKVLWGTLLESATIKDKNTIIFKFKDGTEING